MDGRLLAGMPPEGCARDPFPGGRPGEPPPEREINVESADWLIAGFDSSQARFLMVTAITHHRVSSPIWGEREVHKLYAELGDIERALARIFGLLRRAGAIPPVAAPAGLGRRPAGP
jgi:hypothetical protein